MEERLEAHFENRIYYFTINHREPETVSITMYKTPYVFVKHGTEWKNTTGNKMQMGSGLIEAVMEAIEGVRV